MKRIIVFIAMLASVGGYIQAQDTIWRRIAPLDYYYSDVWLDTMHGYIDIQSGAGVEAVIAKRFITKDTLQVYGIAAMMVPRYFFTAATVSDTEIHSYLNQHYPEDPTYNNLRESLLLYQYHSIGNSAVMQQMGDSLPVDYNNTPVSHYLMTYNMATEGNIISGADSMPKPIYEMFFTTPQTVYDTFYTGFTQSQWQYDSDDGIWYESRPPFYAPAFLHNNPAYWPYTCMAVFGRLANSNNGYTNLEWNFWNNSFTSSFYIFPILVPQDSVPVYDTTGHVIDTTATGDTIIGGDTTNIADTVVIGGGTVLSGDSVIVTDTLIIGGDTVVVNDTVYIGDVNVGSDTVAMGDTLVVTDTLVIGGDTIVVTDTILSIMPPDLLQRLTGVTPNPARGTARVVASMGLTRVEVYSLAGRKVHTQRVPQGALSVTLDVSRWPAGTYLLRIHTPMGATIKKLTVAR